jgi:hypothetical protein
MCARTRGDADKNGGAALQEKKRGVISGYNKNNRESFMGLL